ncbi:hypothetical protein LguiB_033770 [Lonicera macranthoides]
MFEGGALKLDAAQQTSKVIEGATPIASSTVETITSADPAVLAGSGGIFLIPVCNKTKGGGTRASVSESILAENVKSQDEELKAANERIRQLEGQFADTHDMVRQLKETCETATGSNTIWPELDTGQNDGRASRIASTYQSTIWHRN